MSELKIDPEFQSLIPPLLPEEYRQLESNILQSGIRDAIVVWGNIIIDGHNRYDIAQDHDLDFNTHDHEFDSRDEAKLWIIDNQDGRRNLSAWQRTVLQLHKKEIIARRAKAQQGTRTDLLQNSDKGEPIHTNKQIAKKAKVSHDTVHKVEKILELGGEDLRDKLDQQTISINGAYKKVKQEERKIKAQVSEQLALDAMTDRADWTITKDQAVVKCDALITDPPYGILDEHWEPGNGAIEDVTRLWATKWAKCNADFIITFFSQRFLWQGRQWFDESLLGYHFQQLLIWAYPNNKSPQSREGFKQTWEPIFFYRRNDSDKQIKLDNSEWGKGLTDFDHHVAAVPQENFNDVGRKQHPAQKPLSAMMWLVNATTRIGDLVVDPFAGSGTTGIAAVQLGRRFHGIEIDDGYIEIAERRVAAYGNLQQANDDAVSNENESGGDENV